MPVGIAMGRQVLSLLRRKTNNDDLENYRSSRIASAAGDVLKALYP